MERTIKIINESGIHARPASIFVKTVSKFKSDMQVEFGNKVANGKSIMNIMSLGLKQGDEIKIIANGPDEKEAIDKLVELIESKFNLE